MNITEQEYRDHQRVANSDLSTLLYSPKQFYRQKFEGASGKDSSGFLVGNLVDCLVFEEDEFDKRYVLVPEDLKGPYSAQEKSFCDNYLATDDVEVAYTIAYGSYDASKAQDKIAKFQSYFEFMQDEREQFKISDLEVANRCVQSVRLNPHMRKWFNPHSTTHEVHFQPSIFFDYRGVECKARLDCLIIDRENKIIYNIDLKTTGKGLASFPYYYSKYGYHRQQYFYSMAAVEFIKRKKGIILDDTWTMQTIVAVVETVFDNLACPFIISDDILNKGMEQIDNLIERYKWHVKEDKWDYPVEYYESGGLPPLEWVEQ